MKSPTKRDLRGPIFPFIPGDYVQMDHNIFTLLQAMVAALRGQSHAVGRKGRRARMGKSRVGHRLLSQIDLSALETAKASAYDRREVYMHRAARERLHAAKGKRVA